MRNNSRIKLILDTKGISISTAFSSPVSGAQRADAIKDLDLLLKEVQELQKENEELREELKEYKHDWSVWDKNKELQKENEYWKDFARWVAEELDGGPIYDETWECLQKEFKDCTEKEDYAKSSSSKEVDPRKALILETRKRMIEKLEGILDILYNYE